MDTTHHPSPTGDPRLDRLLPLADRLVRAIHTNDQLGVDTAFADAELLYGNALDGARALVVLLAGMCPDDSDADELLSWRLNPIEYRRLRSHGVTAAEARVLAARVAHLQARGA